MKVCQYCDCRVADDIQICPYCGASKYFYICDHCGKNNEKPGKCPGCGHVYGQRTELRPAQTSPLADTVFRSAPEVDLKAYKGRPKNKWVSLGLCFFLGMFGIHKFYEGKIIMGLVYMFTYGLFGFGWFIDLLRLLFKPNPYYVK